MVDIAQGLAQVRARILQAAREYGRDPATVRLLAVSKTQPEAAVRAAWAHGQRSFGENYLQEALPKLEALIDLDLEWHFIGPLQSNKTRPVAERFAWVHSLDTLKHARRLNEQRPARLPPLNVCIQVNISREPQKAGVGVEDLPAFAQAVAALPRLRLRGLMAIPAPEEDFSRQRAVFRAMYVLYRRLQDSGLALDTLSLGMTHDLEAAVAEGATLVRVGTAIFGERLRGGEFQ